jgi:peptide/nickel transport system permease protein
MLLIIVVAVFAPLIAPFSYNEMMTSERPFARPSASHLFGTDNFGRDVFSRVIFGARISLGVAVVCVTFGTLMGVPLGMLAGYVGGWFDSLVMRVSDILMSIPTVLMAVTVTAVVGSGLQVVAITLALVYIPGGARLARSMVYAVKEREYVAAAVVIGERRTQTLIRYILPNIVAPIIVQATLRLSSAVLAEASISYLGYGTQAPTPSWGLMLANSQVYMWQAPFLAIFPGLALVSLVLAGNLMGDGLRDLLDPRLRGRLQ